MKKKTFLFLAAAAVLLVVACNAEDYYARGLEYLNNGDYDRAIVDFTKANILDPNFPHHAKADNNRKYAYSKGMCIVHNISMSKGILRINYGLINAVYAELFEEYFPNSDVWPWGGCVDPGYPQYFEGYFCEACNTERDIYKETWKNKDGLR